MSLYDDLIKEVEDTDFLGVSGDEYLFAILAFLAYTFVIFLVKFQLKRFSIKLKNMERMKEATFLSSLGKILSFWLVISLSFYMASLRVTSINQSTVVDGKTVVENFHDGVEFWLNLFLLVIITRYLLKFSGQVVEEVFEEILERRPDLQHLAEFLRLMVTALIWIFVTLWFFVQLGVDITAYLAGLSILGLAMAFALQNVIADIFASVTLYLDKPFEIGDSIKVGGDAGKVERIGLRSTHIRTGTGNLLVISNRELVGQRIHNNSDMKERRIVLTLGVDCNTPVAKLKKVPSWAEKIIDKVENTRFNRAHLTTLGIYSWDFQIVYYITTSDYTAYLDAQQKVNLDILAKLEKEEISIPYPTNTVLST